MVLYYVEMEGNKRRVHFYNFERPNQAITCGNQPPRPKFPNMASLTSVLQTIDPNRLAIGVDRQDVQAQIRFVRLFSIGKPNLLRPEKPTRTNRCNLGGWTKTHIEYLCQSGSGQEFAD